MAATLQCTVKSRNKDSVKVVTKQNINDFLHVADGVITAHVTLYHATKQEPWFKTWEMWKHKNLLNLYGEQGIIYIMLGVKSTEINTKVIFNALETYIPIIKDYINIIYVKTNTTVKWNYRTKDDPPSTTVETDDRVRRSMPDCLPAVTGISKPVIESKCPNGRKLVEPRSRLDTNTLEGGKVNGSQPKLLRCASTPISQNRISMTTRMEILEKRLWEGVQEKNQNKNLNLNLEDVAESSYPSKSSVEERDDHTDISSSLKISGVQEDQNVGHSPCEAPQDSIAQSYNNDTRKKIPLNIRVETLEELAFDDGETRNGLLVSRIKDLEQFVFPQGHTPPNNLTSRVDALALEFE